MSSVSYDQTLITNWLGPHTVAKAHDYIHAVSGLQWKSNSNILSGKVQGTSYRPYKAEIYFHKIKGHLEVECDCSCPVGFDCKHVAAVLMAGLKKMPKAPPDSMRSELVSWLENFRSQHALTVRQARGPQPLKHTLAYVLTWLRSRQQYEVQIFKARLSKEGTIQAIEQFWNNVETSLTKTPKFITRDDLVILRELWLGHCKDISSDTYPLFGADGADVLQKMVLTGRLFIAPPTSHQPTSPIALSLGNTRPGQIQWQLQSDGRLRPAVHTEPPSMILLATDPPWYVDTRAAEAGVITQLSLPFRQLIDYLSIPPILQTETSLVAAMLNEVSSNLPLPPHIPHFSATRHRERAYPPSCHLIHNPY